jgi:hypothetical protein
MAPLVHHGHGRVRAGLQALVLAGACALALGACLIEKHDFDEKLADCTDYCSRVMSKCTGSLKVYDRNEECMGVCALMDPGDRLKGSQGNTLACRQELLATSFEPTTECALVGPGGHDGQCGSDCEAFCSLRQQVCSGVPGQEDQPDLQSSDECLRECGALAAQPFNPSEPSLSAERDTAGDTLQCRLIHVSEASVSPSLALIHCPHSQAIPGEEPGPCTDDDTLDESTNCSTYCKLVQSACTGNLQVYESQSQCLAACAVLDPGKQGDESQNTVRCRRYHSYNALLDPATHCTHAGPTGDGTCGTDNCHAYCQILKGGCPTEFASVYGGDAADLGSCEDTSQGIAESKAIAFHDAKPRYSVNTQPTGDHMLCRTFHAVRAIASAAPDGDECAAAFGEPGSVCGPPAPAP